MLETLQALLSGERRLQAPAISAAPCGFCRRFLFERASGPDLPILLPGASGAGPVTQALGAYIPHGFGPADLGKTARIMTPGQPPRRLEQVSGSADDPLVRAALDAAALSHAPCSGGLAGCALQTARGHIHAGRYAENAACNPSLSALASAIALQRVSQPPDDPDPVTRAVLVEVASRAGQLGASQAVLAAWAPGVAPAHCPARLAGQHG